VYRIAVDVGGTYTDCVAIDEAGVKTACKAPTTPADRTLGVIGSLRAVAAQLQLGELGHLLRSTTRLVHGSTVATNVMVERRGSRTALLTTRGHEDAIFIGRGRQRVAGLSESEITHVTHHRKPEPLIPRARAIGLRERVDSTGEVLHRLERAEVEAALRRLADDGVESLAVCMLWSIANPVHEQLVRDVVAQAHGTAFYVSLSSEVAPVLGEYERLTSTAINAYIGPAVTAYTTRLEASLRDAGLAVPILFTQANGGLAAGAYVQDRPIVMLDSGPAAGVRGVAAFSSSIAETNILCADVGGTTFDVGVVTAARPEQDEFPVIDQFEFRNRQAAYRCHACGTYFTFVVPAGSETQRSQLTRRVRWTLQQVTTVNSWAGDYGFLLELSSCPACAQQHAVEVIWAFSLMSAGSTEHLDSKAEHPATP
jgi:N-methylhydantoinase A